MRGWLLALLCATFGYVVCLLTIAAITWDLEQFRRGAVTISAWFLDTGRDYPFLPALAGLIVGLILGTLVGHLGFPQYR
ncbi:MAG TPA: hypothetical protein VFA26_05340 [Gemmataceae bacterium]|nr:hypothetical protein [Gemmataceae bacterium]